jgi:N-acetylglutamate synthase-like GNAT family acetyltransferase
VSVEVRLGTADDLPAVAELYLEWGYRSSASPDDTLIIAEHDRRVVGVVRLAIEHDHMVLRGMRVQPAFQRTGVGTRMLELLVKQLKKRECFGIPYEHLLTFYGRAGFREIEANGAPTFLVERAASYRADGLKVAIIRRPP